MAGSASARHEAGHAVAAHLLGRRVLHVGLFGGPLDGPHTIDEPPEDVVGVNALADDALVFAVGAIAAGQPAQPHGASDFHYLGKLSAAATLDAEEAAAFEAWIVCRARALTRHPHFNALHTHLVEALDRAGEHGLDEDLLTAEIARAEHRYRTAPLDITRPHRVAEPEQEPLMARTAAPPVFAQCREPVVAEINGEELYALRGDIYRTDHVLVRHFPEAFVALGGLPDAPRYVPDHARVDG